MEGSSFSSETEANRKYDLKLPLLQPPDGGTSAAFPPLTPVQEKDDRVRTVMFRVGGISCTACAVSIEAAVGQLDGVESVAVSPLQGHAAVRYIPELISVSQILTLNADSGKNFWIY